LQDPSVNRQAFALYGILLCILGLVAYLSGVVLALPRRLLLPDGELLAFNQALVWFSGVPILVGLSLILFDLFVLFPGKRQNEFVMFEQPRSKALTVALTAYNDEGSIGQAVADFLGHPLVSRVIVVSNNSRDRTMEVAAEAGAVVFNETVQGYGACVHRALTESIGFDDTELVALCEGDMTFRAYDLDKLIAYAAHAHVVTGTRTVEQLRDRETQLSTFMFYGNLFVGKLLEIKHLGAVTLSDVGTTYKLCRRDMLRDLLPKLSKHVNLEFNPYFLDRALGEGFRVVECPITFHKRIGDSKGGNINNGVAFKLGLRMIRGVVIGWRDSTR
jgi:glycosyltransferase involved in cell wall biosynthesis